MNKTEQLLHLRKRKQGLLIMDARIVARRSITDCSEWLGISAEQYRDIENGNQSPSLPELESLAFLFNVPMSHFGGSHSLSESPSFYTSDKVRNFIDTRNQIIASVMKEKREKYGFTLDKVAEKTGMAKEDLEKFEEGQHVLSIAELELLSSALDQDLESLYDTETDIGIMQIKKREFEHYLSIPEEIRKFVSQPINEPFLLLAKRLSKMPADELRDIAESLLEITL